MEKRSPIIRLFVALWLLSTQIAGAALILAPVLVLFSFRALGANDPNPGGFNTLMILAYILPVVFLALGIAAWVFFARRKDGVSSLIGLATLLPGGIMQMAINLFMG